MKIHPLIYNYLMYLPFLIVTQDSFICESGSFDLDEGIPKRCVPTQTQIRQQLGSKLSDIFFEYVGNEGKAYLGLEPPLVGPETIWIDPDGRLGGKVAFTPVPEPQVLRLKAFTHRAVLEVGEMHIQLLENKHRLEIEEALRRQADELEEECKKRLAAVDGFSGAEGGGQTSKVVRTLMEHFDACFNDLVKTTQLRMRKECQKRVDEERAEIASAMLVKLQEEVERHDFELCSEFHDILGSELNILASRFIKQINKEREIASELLRETVRNYEKMMSDMRTEMELSCVVDVCRAINQERLECSERVRLIEQELRSKQNDLSKYIEELKRENCILQKMATERLKRLMLWRTKVRELLEEFQKFINFAMKAVPGQSEFMLNMEALMLRKYPEDSFLLPEDYINFKKCMAGRLPPSEELLPEVEEPSETESEVIDEQLSGEKTPDYCYKSLYHDEEDPSYAFNYDQFKGMLVGKFASDLKADTGEKKKPKKTVCLWKKKSKGIQINKSNEFYKMLTLVGENEKEHLSPVNCFLYRRLKAVKNICRDDPEFAKIILGCPNK